MRKEVVFPSEPFPSPLTPPLRGKSGGLGRGVFLSSTHRCFRLEAPLILLHSSAPPNPLYRDCVSGRSLLVFQFSSFPVSVLARDSYLSASERITPPPQQGKCYSKRLYFPHCALLRDEAFQSFQPPFFISSRR